MYFINQCFFPILLFLSTIQALDPLLDRTFRHIGREAFTFQPVARTSHLLPLSPRPELADVAKGMTVLPLKSLCLTKVSTGQAAIPHQIGYPMKTVS